MNATSKVKLLARVYIHVAQVVPLYNYAAKLEQYMWGWIKIINHAQYDKKLYMSYLYVECRVEPVYRPLALTANHVVNVTCKVKMGVAGYECSSPQM